MIDDNELVETPDEVNKENIFLEKDRYMNSENKSGLLDFHINTMFNPSKRALHDQCFNLNYFLAALILVRLVYYRDNCPSFLLGGIGIKHDSPNEDFDKIQKKELETINYIIKGFWNYVNCPEMTPEQKEHWKKAKHLLADHWDSLWF